MARLQQGYLSAIDYGAGKATVVFKDRDNKVSKFLPFLNAEYYPYKVDDLVLVLTLDNSPEDGVILGTIFSQKNVPNGGKEGLYYKEMSRTPGRARMAFDDETGILTVTGVSDMIVNGISVTGHRHTCPDGETSEPN